jgi:hypothetical protein
MIDTAALVATIGPAQIIETILGFLSLITWVEVRVRAIINDKLEVQNEKHQATETLLANMQSALSSFTDKMGEHVLSLTAAISRLEGKLSKGDTN